MIGRRGVMTVMAATASVLALGGCSLLDTHYRYRYKITVEVETPDSLKTGSSVQEQSVTKYYMQDMAGNIRNMQTRGEAVAVDLPNGQTLFALLCDSNVTQSALDPAWQNDWVESARRITAGETPRTALVVAPTRSEIGYKDGRAVTKTEPHYPMLVRFRDSKDPTTVELVDPAELAATFGPAVKLKRITVQITDEPVTVGIVKRLDRIGVEAGHGLDRTLGVTASPTLAQKLGYSDFVNGDGN